MPGEEVGLRVSYEGGHAGPAEPPRLRRAEDGILGGVAAGIGRYAGIDPVAVRLVFALLTVFFGAGLLLYLVTWVTVPSPAGGVPPAQALLARVADAPGWLRALIVVSAVLLLIDAVASEGSGVLVGLLLAACGIVLLAYDATTDARAQRPGAAGSAGPAVPPPGATAAGSTRAPWPAPAGVVAPARPAWPAPAGVGEAARPAWPASTGVGEAARPAWPAPAAGAAAGGTAEPGIGAPAAAGWGSWGVPPAREPWQPGQPGWDAPRPRQPWPSTPGWSPPAEVVPKHPPSVLGRLIVALILAGTGLAAVADRVGLAELTLTRGLAVALVAVGFGLVLGAWWGRARGFVVVGVLLLGALTAVQLLGVLTTGGVGELRVQPTTVAEVDGSYRLLGGVSVLDLSAVDFPEAPTRVSASVGAGRLEVIVPPAVSVTVEGRMGAGQLQLLGREVNGTGVERSVSDRGDEGGGRLELDLDGGIGQVVVRRAGGAGGRP